MDVSIITAVMNRVSQLGECLHSVQAQRNVAAEHLVVDGGSTDGSKALIQQHAGQLAYWVSEPDKGIADAMNKGIRQARGEWLLFLHSDDQLLCPLSLHSCMQVLSHSRADIVGFPIQYGTPPQTRVLHPRGAGPWLNFKTGLLHQGTFIRRRLFEQLGLYDCRFQIAMDYEFFLRAKRSGAHIITDASCVTTLMRDTGVSSRLDWPSLQKRFAEERAIHALHANSLSLRAAYAIYWRLYLPYRHLQAAARAV